MTKYNNPNDAKEVFAKMPDKQAALNDLVCELENGAEEIERFADRVDDYFENQLLEDADRY